MGVIGVEILCMSISCPTTTSVPGTAMPSEECSECTVGRTTNQSAAVGIGAPDHTIIDLGENTLFGPIPTELGHLLSLEVLHIRANSLTEKIPTELGQLTSLKDLDVSINQLSGRIPTELGRLTSLQDLDMFDNYLAGTIPTEPVNCFPWKSSSCPTIN